MGTSDKAFKIVAVAAIASVAAYLGYRAYKKRYPFEDSIPKTAPIDPKSVERENISIGNIFFCSFLNLIVFVAKDNCCEKSECEIKEISAETEEVLYHFFNICY